MWSSLIHVVGKGRKTFKYKLHTLKTAFRKHGTCYVTGRVSLKHGTGYDT